MISKWFAIILSAALMLLCIFDIDAADVAIYARCGIANRLLYPFFHANILHCVFNVYCLLSLVFLSNNTLIHFIVAFQDPNESKHVRSPRALSVFFESDRS